jgi:hypothetical protein
MGAHRGGGLLLGGSLLLKTDERAVVRGDQVGGDKVAGDKVAGDKVAGDKVVVNPGPSMEEIKQAIREVLAENGARLKSDYPDGNTVFGVTPKGIVPPPPPRAHLPMRSRSTGQLRVS